MELSELFVQARGKGFAVGHFILEGLYVASLAGIEWYRRKHLTISIIEPSQPPVSEKPI